MNKLIQQKIKLDLVKSRDGQVVQVFAVEATPKTNTNHSLVKAKWTRWNRKGVSGQLCVPAE